MQSKNKNQTWILSPAWQMAGVIFTALLLGFIQFHFQKRFTPDFDNSLLYPLLIFLSVTIFYCLDHLYDEFRFRRTDAHRKRSFALNIVVSSLAFLIILAILVQNYGVVKLRNLIVPAVLTVFYFVGMVSGVKLRWVKEILISLVVSYALVYPLWGSVENAILLPVFSCLVLVCFQNLIVFGVFEKKKDEYYGFITAFTGYSETTTQRTALAMAVLLTITIGILQFFSDEKIYGAFICVGLYFLMLLFPRYFEKLRIYRFVADGILIFLVI